MLNICNTFASTHGLLFNAGKTQLIYFRNAKVPKFLPVIRFGNTILQFTDEVKHLGHILHYKLDDGPDITRAVKELNKKANSVLCLFHAADPLVKTYLIKMYCLSLYGCQLWSLSSTSLSVLQVALNKILRKVWNLPSRSHSSIVHCIARVPSIANIVLSRFNRFIIRSLESSSQTVLTVMQHAVLLPYSFFGYNHLYGNNHLKLYSLSDHDISFHIRSIRFNFGTTSPFEHDIHNLCCC